MGTNLVVKVSLDGILHVVAGNGIPGLSGDGGPATSAALSAPYGVVGDAVGNLYIADSGNHRIRKVSASGTIATVAGIGQPDFSGDGGPATSASLHNPLGVAVDAAGNLYIADTDNYRIRKVSASGTIPPWQASGSRIFPETEGRPRVPHFVIH